MTGRVRAESIVVLSKVPKLGAVVAWINEVRLTLRSASELLETAIDAAEANGIVSKEWIAEAKRLIGEDE